MKYACAYTNICVCVYVYERDEEKVEGVVERIEREREPCDILVFVVSLKTVDSMIF